MNNYEYIVASLPLIASPEYRFPAGVTPDSILEEILSQLSEKDREMVQLLESGFNGEDLTSDFYLKALGCKDRFIRDYFSFDLGLRNTKVKWLNKVLGREKGTDIMDVGGEFEHEKAVMDVLEGGDLLQRESAIDSLMWNHIDQLTTFNYFDLDAILGFLAKLNIVSRWFKLDENTGRELFKKLVDEVRGTFKGVDFKDK